MLTLATTFMFFALLAALATVLTGMYFTTGRHTRAYGKKCIGVGSASAGLAFIAFSLLGQQLIEIDAHKNGFDDAADQRAAQAANIADASKWHIERNQHKHEAEIAAQAQRTVQADLARKRAEAEHAAMAQKQAQEESDRKRETAVAAEHARLLEVQQKVQAELDQANVERQALHDRKEKLYSESYARSVSLLKFALKDPASADFEGAHSVRLPGGKMAICGLVNARNSFGGYTGFKRFVVVADLSIVEVEGVLENVALDDAWSRYCQQTDESE